MASKKISSQKVVFISFVMNLAEIVFNFAIFLVTGSVVLLSQALESTADLLASGMLLVGVRRSFKPRDKKHPFGYGRELYFWTFLSALITFVITAGTSIYFGYQRFINPEAIHSIELALITLLVSFATNLYSLNFSLRRILGTNKIYNIFHAFNHSALIETKTTLVLDLMGTSAALLGMAALSAYSLTGIARLDGIGAMAIGLTLAILAFFILKSAKDLLVGQSASVKVEEKIKKIVTASPNVSKVIALRTLHTGPERLLINLELNLADHLTTDEIEKLIDKIERNIKKEISAKTNIQIELETPDVDK